MYSLLYPPSASVWPLSFDLPKLPALSGQPLFLEKAASETSSPKTAGASQVSACPHVHRKHYAKKMCSVCYHRFGRRKLAWNCEHSERFNYSKGFCQPCYLRHYIRSRPKNIPFSD